MVSPISGTFPETGVFSKIEPTAADDIEDVLADYVRSNAAVLASCTSSGDAEQDRSLYAKTLDEVEPGWLQGPLDHDDVARLGPHLVSKRFGVVQGSKLRPVDDYSVSGINGTLCATEAIDPADVDQVTSNCRSHADALAIDPRLRGSGSPFTV